MTQRRGLAPSIIAADFASLGEQLGAVEEHATSWHVDVMDGHHVPNLTIGPLVVEAIARVSTLPQDVHLMITNPDEAWEWYADAGAARIAFHPDQSQHAHGLLRRIHDRGVRPGLAVNPDVGADEIKPYLSDVDHLIVMSVYPGFSGQAFIPDVLPKLTTLRDWIDDGNVDVQLIIDGGVNTDTAPRCIDAGADVLVSASAIFGATSPADVAARLRAEAERDRD